MEAGVNMVVHVARCMRPTCAEFAMLRFFCGVGLTVANRGGGISSYKCRKIVIALPFQNTPKTISDIRKTMSYVERIMSDVEKTTSDIISDVCNVQ